MNPYELDVYKGDHRKATRQILKNEGLKRYRGLRHKKISRVRMRNKYETAMKKRKKQFRSMKQTSLIYEGERNINAKLIRAVQFKNRGRNS